MIGVTYIVYLVIRSFMIIYDMIYKLIRGRRRFAILQLKRILRASNRSLNISHSNLHVEIYNKVFKPKRRYISYKPRQ